MVLVVVACVNMVLFCVFAGEALIQQQQQHHHLTAAAAAAPPDIRDALFQTAAMAKKFQLVDTFERRTPTTTTETNWKLCLVCQEETSESLVCPVLSKRRDPGSGYTTMAANLVKFDELGKLPRTVQLQRLDEGQGVEATMVAHQAKWHKTCMLKYNNTMLRRAEKRLIASSSAFGSTDNVPGKRARTHSSEATTSDTSCFFCGKSGTETLHEVATFQVDTRVRKCAAQVGDNELMARLSMGDMVVLEAKYHSKCLLANTFEEYAQQVFIPYVVQQLQHVSRLDLVWDSYRADSLKASTREHHGKGVRRRVVDSAVIPGNWQSFLRVDGNKVELFSYLSTMLAESFQEEGKELVVTDGEQVICVPQQEDVNSLAPCNQEEADTRMMLHVAHAAQHGHHQIQVRTVDTDVVVLAVMVVQKLPAGDELWVAFGTGKNYRYIAAHEIASSLGPEKTCALPMFHAITGCDTVSAFVGHGKKSAWATWNTLPELTDALLSLANAPTSIQEDTMHVIERFVILQYDRTSKCKDVNKARKKLFAKKSSVQNIPPTYAALEQHVKRSALQGGHVWGQALVPEPVLPPPTDWGWHRSDDGPYTPLWTTLPEASKTCYELVSCGCKKGCRKRCKCKNASLQCTGLCFCEGECQ